MTQWQLEVWCVALKKKKKKMHIARLASAFLWQESKEALQEQVTHVWSEAGCTLVLLLRRLVQAGLSAQGEEQRGKQRTWV